MSARHLLLLIILAWFILDVVMPVVRTTLGYSAEAIIGLVILWYVFFDGPRSGPVV